MAPEVRYWDTGPILAWLKREAHHLPDVEPVIRATDEGRVRLVTSSVTLVEVVKLDQKNAPVTVPPEDAELIRKFFQRSALSVRALDSLTTGIARQLIWDHGLEVRDAVHLATALRWKIPLLETYDRKDLVRLSGKVGTPPIEIRLPRYDAPPEGDTEVSTAGIQTAFGFEDDPT